MFCHSVVEVQDLIVSVLEKVWKRIGLRAFVLHQSAGQSCHGSQREP